MNKFNQTYNKIKRKISLIVEDFNINSDTTLKENVFDFKKDDLNNVICSFSITKNGESLIVIAKIINEKLSFDITENNGNSYNLSEKEFMVKFSRDYEDFKNALTKYLDDDKLTDYDNIENGKISSIDQEIENQTNRDDAIKFEKEFVIGSSKFIFKLLNDISVENYCECIFDFQNKLNETIYVRSLLNIMIKNSVIIKLLLFNEKGELLEKMTKTEFMKEFEDKYEEFRKAIKKMEQYVSEQ